MLHNIRKSGLEVICFSILLISGYSLYIQYSPPKRTNFQENLTNHPRPKSRINSVQNV
uniref:Secretory protein n=1 Tax=Chilobrachys guangxiensis TaxID=278060 RepID=B1P1J7_CHIGU|nr:secretory protein [Chilobrachys guangxiensis]